MEADFGTTDMAMSRNGAASGDDTLMVRFFLHPRENAAKSKEAGRPIFEEIPYISIKQPGQKDSEVVAPVREKHKDRFPRHWAMFEAKKDQEAVSGTLREEWPGVTRPVAEELKHFNIRTVEQLAGMSDANAQNMMGINGLKQKANDWLESSDNQASAIALRESTEMNEMLLKAIEDIKKQYEEQTEVIAHLKAQLAE